MLRGKQVKFIGRKEDEPMALFFYQPSPLNLFMP